MHFYTAFLFVVFSLTSLNTHAEEPFSMEGLFDDMESGESTFTADEGYDDLDEEESSFSLSGFWEARLGYRTRDDVFQKPWSLAETRLQLQADKTWDAISGRITADLLYDPVRDELPSGIENINTGRGWLDLREANLLFRPTSNIDVKAGRQILTWGTGDMLFINDLFPKDWNSFFIGRDDEYLKAPSDAVKFSIFADAVNVDVVYTPEFDSDRYLDGERLSYYDRNNNVIAGRNNPIVAENKNNWFADSEVALRFYKNVKAYEVAAYVYRGYWKSPAGQQNGIFTFPSLSVYGASIRGPLHKGIINAEVGYYDSREDDNGNNGAVDNSELRFLVGYEQEIIPNLTGGIQYYQERMMNYSGYLATLPVGIVAKDKNRHLITIRLTKLAYNQNLRLSLFNFWSPSDTDGYTRIKANYKLDDSWQIEAGGNFFYSRRISTFFGGFQDNANVFTGVRYSF